MWSIIFLENEGFLKKIIIIKVFFLIQYSYKILFFCTFQVNLRSLGEAAGLQAGDIIFSVDGQDISLLKHKEAQEAIKRAGHNFVLTVGRY